MYLLPWRGFPAPIAWHVGECLCGATARVVLGQSLECPRCAERGWRAYHSANRLFAAMGRKDGVAFAAAAFDLLAPRVGA